MPACPARSVAITLPPSRLTAAATARPTAPAAPVISTILSCRRAMDRDGGRRATEDGEDARYRGEAGRCVPSELVETGRTVLIGRVIGTRGSRRRRRLLARGG